MWEIAASEERERARVLDSGRPRRTLPVHQEAPDFFHKPHKPILAVLRYKIEVSNEWSPDPAATLTQARS